MRINLITDDFSTIERLAKSGELVKLNINWFETIIQWNFFYNATVDFK